MLLINAGCLAPAPPKRSRRRGEEEEENASVGGYVCYVTYVAKLTRLLAFEVRQIVGINLVYLATCISMAALWDVVVVALSRFLIQITICYQEQRNCCCFMALCPPPMLSPTALQIKLLCLPAYISYPWYRTNPQLQHLFFAAKLVFFLSLLKDELSRHKWLHAAYKKLLITSCDVCASFFFFFLPPLSCPPTMYIHPCVSWYTFIFY